ncbi:glycosyltransferase family 4 protein [Actinomycetospora sp. OC33-EN08]|uniref:Glycosyltransferase family 4 protein n=1 Tax=Actinomycetospora aurantiaca TaxID=3129233 RepID=A0ABU8MFZ7_9PSEU
MSARRPRVLIISHAYSEPMLREQILRLNEHLPVRLVAPRRWRALVFDDFEVVGDADGVTCTFERVGLFGAQYVLRSATLDIRSWKPDIVHVDYDPWSAIFWQARVLTWLLAPRCTLAVTTKKNTFRRYPGLRGRLKYQVARLGFRACDFIVAASEMARSMVCETFAVDPARIAVTTHVGVDSSVFRPVERANRAVVIGYCGRLSEHKGVLDLVDAVDRVAATGREVELHLLGAGPLSQTLQELAASRPWLRVLDAVPVDEVADFLGQLDVYALPARILEDHQEHDAHAMLQAMSVGLPVVATRSGIIPEILSDGVSGWIIPANSTDELVAGLTTAVDDRVLRREIGRAAREVAMRRFDLGTVARSRSEVYAGMVAGPR